LGNNMFAYCFNNPVNMSDSSGNWPKLSKVFMAVAAVATVVAVTAAVVVTCGAAAPVVAAITGTVVSSASATATVAAVATTSCSVAIASTTVSAVAYTQEELAKKSGSKNHSVYVLKDADQNVQYVGRTSNIQARAAAHSTNPNRANLEMEVLATGLSYGEARALEQAGMIYHHTLNTADKMNNQVNGISPKFWGDFILVAEGTINYAWNNMTNEILCWAGL